MINNKNKKLVGARMNISLCMIVKNEEKFIESCLKSAMPYINGATIVDTGSTDSTIEKIKKFPNVDIKNYKWNDDFAEARNYSIENIGSEWILYLDADEELVVHDKNAFEKALETHAIYSIRIVNLTDDSPVLSACPRLFPNKKNIKFIGKVHETVDSQTVGNLETKSLPGVEIIHHGYKSKIKEEKKKDERNLRILEKELMNDPNNIRTLYCLGQEYYLLKRYDESIKCINQAIDLFEDNDNATETFKPLIISMYALILSDMNDKSKILDLHNKYKDVQSPDYNLTMARFFSHYGDEGRMLSCANRALSFRCTPVLLPASYDSGSFTWKPHAILADFYIESNLALCLYHSTEAMYAGCNDTRVHQNVIILASKCKNDKLAQAAKNLMDKLSRSSK